MLRLRRLIATSSIAASYLALAQIAFAATIDSPVNVTDIGGIFNNLFLFFIALVGGLAVVFIVIGGIRYIMAGGDPKATDSARDQITAALIGLVVALLAVVIVNIVGSFFGVNKVGSNPECAKPASQRVGNPDCNK